MFAPQALIKGLVQRVLPLSPKPDSADIDQAVRLARYGELMGHPLAMTKNQLLEEGSYFIARTPTPGTGVAYNVQATFSDTVPFLYLFNKDAAGGKTCYLDYLKIIVTVAAASGVTVQGAIKLDNVARYPTTDNTTAAIINANNFGLPGAAQSVMQVRYQSSGTASAVPAASSNARVAAEWAGLGGVTIVGDELIVEFGKTDQSGSTVLTAAQATYAGRKVTSAGPVAIAPQTSAVVHLWAASNAVTGLSYSLELGMIER